jgi:arsenate reductase-like glutaredoxin family protein
MQVWGIAYCDKTKLALGDLRAGGFAPVLTDIRDPGMDADMRAAAVKALGDKMVNKSSTTWRALPPADQAMPVADLVARHPTVVKRPVILHEGRWTCGWTDIVKQRYGL